MTLVVDGLAGAQGTSLGHRQDIFSSRRVLIANAIELMQCPEGVNYAALTRVIAAAGPTQGSLSRMVVALERKAGLSEKPEVCALFQRMAGNNTLSPAVQRMLTTWRGPAEVPQF